MRRRKRLLLGGALVVVLLLVVVIGGYLFGSGVLGGGLGGSAPHEAMTRPAAAPVAATGLTGALTSRGFTCYDTQPAPTPVRSCYRTESDGTRLVVRIGSASGDQAALVEIDAAPFSGIRGEHRTTGDAVGPVREVIEVVGKPLLGQEYAGLPTFGDGVDQATRLSWGSVSFTAHPEAATASFTRSGAPEMPRGTDFPKDPGAMSAALGKVGYECDADSCTPKSSAYDVRAKFSAAEATMSAIHYDGKAKVTDAELRSRYADLLRQVADGMQSDEARRWVDGHLTPKNGFVEGDVAGLHLAVARTDSGDGQLTVTPKLTRGR
ncbi:hypothetical protein SAMN05421678_104213 [Actinopolymorpha cephalotaxi]|uniref:Uncharacterized protein n=1 Tax=Actinopolymorpha cephalotaxi TaxID=504797 RepID=A0A1I2PVH5_9ACTN|nr:hypothetical protein [Actinopolymorpha cephalotaxi]NYH83535.1 hypothetical protein [Actinopolymorpha cephalotaxi]SFG17616.1 hypothetical protein SAMN05421678_104213 [Actinopolymorpha cephalotaxi]